VNELLDSRGSLQLGLGPTSTQRRFGSYGLGFNKNKRMVAEKWNEERRNELMVVPQIGCK